MMWTLLGYLSDLRVVPLQLIELKQNLETVHLYTTEPLHKLRFITKALDNSCIIGPWKKLVAIYAMKKERL